MATDFQFDVRTSRRRLCLRTCLCSSVRQFL